LAGVLKGVDAMVFALRHPVYKKLSSEEILKMTGRPVEVIDDFAILDDSKIRKFFEFGCEVKGLGREHVKRIKKRSEKEIKHIRSLNARL